MSATVAKRRLPAPMPPPSADGDGRPVTPFGARLRELRFKAGMTQAALAKGAGVSAGYIGLIETGERGERPSLDIVKRLGQALQATVKDTESLLRASGHLGEYETLVVADRPTFAQLISADRELTKTQVAILVSMYRSWTGHE